MRCICCGGSFAKKELTRWRFFDKEKGELWCDDCSMKVVVPTIHFIDRKVKRNKAV